MATLLLGKRTGNDVLVKWRQDVTISTTGVVTIAAGSGGGYFYLAGDPGAAGSAAQAYTGSGQTIQANAVISTIPVVAEAAARAAGDIPACAR